MEEPRMKAVSTTVVTSSDSTKCPVCHGNGWELYTVSGKDLEDVYGYDAPDVEYARPCSACKGFKKASEDLTCVPDMYRDADMSKFDFDIYGVDLKNLRTIVYSFFNEFNTRWRSQGMGLYIFSKTPGSGKTFLACCIGKSVMIKYNLRFKFITAVDYMDKVSEGYANKKNNVFEDPSKIFRECELLVLDDIGAQMSKPWQDQELFKLLNERMTNGLVTIFTSNNSLESLNIDERAKSRIYRTAIQINMPEVSIRKKDGDSRQNEFLKGILK